jgi:phage terminase large subunit-like protein
MKISQTTRRWIRNESDEKAAHAGYRCDEKRGQFVVDWIAKYLTLYEGEAAGQPFECRDWQYECTMRMFGWIKRSARWKRDCRRFREASIWVPKKNKKSPTLAAWGLYLTCGDGEQGQKVFLGAKDGKQAKQIAGKHAIEMVRASPALMEECVILIGEASIEHRPTKSILMPLSSSNASTQAAKEGINGSVLIDETHVVDREFIARICRAGISRSEPFHIEVSTAGKSIDCYGKERQDYARLVQSGEKEDHAIFVYIAEAPQDLSDEELAADPVKYGKMANPAWGHTVCKEEFLHDYQQSSANIHTLADFKTYRLNIWQRAANPWLRKDDWARCARNFTAEDLDGQTCGAAFDLGKTDDMSALALVFPADPQAWETALAEVRELSGEKGPEGTAAAADAVEPAEDLAVRLSCLEQAVRVLTYYWLPEEAIQRYGHIVPYAEWAASGVLRVMPGRTVDQDVIRADAVEILQRYQVRAFAHDPWYAAILVAALQREEGFPSDTFYPFAQTIKNYAWPCALFEKLVIGGKWGHNNHPITTWQAGHVSVWTDPNGNVRPVKPKRDDRKKIDGIVAGVMALDAATRIDPNVSIYASAAPFYLGAGQPQASGQAPAADGQKPKTVRSCEGREVNVEWIEGWNG